MAVIEFQFTHTSKFYLLTGSAVELDFFAFLLFDFDFSLGTFDPLSLLEVGFDTFGRPISSNQNILWRLYIGQSGIQSFKRVQK